MMQPIKLSRQQARRLTVYCQLLDGASDDVPENHALQHIIQKLGYIQLDTIYVVERAHHHTFWNRWPEYHPSMLNEKLRSGQVFEYWAHAFSYVPMADYRFYLPRMQAYQRLEGKWERARFHKYGSMLQPLLERLRVDGPLTSSELKSDSQKKTDPQGWFSNPTRQALEFLLLRGEVMIAERRKFQRVYDLTERVLPANVDTTLPDVDEQTRFFILRALAAQGIIKERDIHLHIQMVDKGPLSECLQRMVQQEEILLFEVQEEPRQFYYALPQTLSLLSEQEYEPSRLTLLSPFDNLLFSRQRVSELFEFDYRLECYTPAAQRKYGYFVLPILWGDRLVARLDARAVRKLRRFEVKYLAFEEDFSSFEVFLPVLSAALKKFASFNACDEIVINAVAPARYASVLQRLID